MAPTLQTSIVCMMAAMATVLWARPLPSRTPLELRSRDVRSASSPLASERLNSLVTGVFVVSKVLQEKILPSPSTIPDDLLDDLYNTIDVAFQLIDIDVVANQSANQTTVLKPFTSAVSEQVLLWLGIVLNCSETNGCTREDLVSLKQNLSIYKTFQQGLNALLNLASNGGFTNGISETVWIRKSIICSGRATDATISVIRALYPSMNLARNC